MMHKIIIYFTVLLISISSSINAQNYQSYIQGDTSNYQINAKGGICMMGGATENDSAILWFLQKANGGDILVLRASGGNAYNSYMMGLDNSLNSVETIIFNHQSASNEAYIHNRIMQAEAIWFAGGDQWDYINYWRNTKIDSLINDAIQNRNIVIGGTSAGMAILGDYYFTAENGTIQSNDALNNPFHQNITIDSTSFIDLDILKNTITDTHYDNPDRKGRQITFMARMVNDYNIRAKGIACDEYTTICIDTLGLASVFGDYPNYDDNAYFLQANCELNNFTPETCIANSPLQWERDSIAVKVYHTNGTPSGSNTFNLNDWRSGNGGSWQNWWVKNGILSDATGNQINCSNSLSEAKRNIKIYPNPAKDFIKITGISNFDKVKIYNQYGSLCAVLQHSDKINISGLRPAFYIMHIKDNNIEYRFSFIKI